MGAFGYGLLENTAAKKYFEAVGATQHPLKLLIDTLQATEKKKRKKGALYVPIEEAHQVIVTAIYLLGFLEFEGLDTLGITPEQVDMVKAVVKKETDWEKYKDVTFKVGDREVVIEKFVRLKLELIAQSGDHSEMFLFWAETDEFHSWVKTILHLIAEL